MKIAVLADIHGNHIPFEKCVEYIEKQGITHYILLGDYIGEYPCPQKTMNLLYWLEDNRNCIFISGNKENYWVNYRNNGETGWEDGSSVTGSLLYSYNNLSKEDVLFFENMPKEAICDWVEGHPLKLIHIPPYMDTYVSSEDVRDASKLIKKVNEELPVVFCAHRHVQGQIDYEGIQYINPGSVGVPLFCGGKTQLAIIEYDGDNWDIEYISLDFDIDSMLEEIEMEKMMEHAPCWTKMSVALFTKGAPAHSKGLFTAMDVTRKKFGECNWPHIPEECFEEALEIIGKEYGFTY